MARGYTLIELVVAVGLFALVMTLAAGAYLLMIDLSRQAQSISTGINNLSFVLETMTRGIRTGTSYSCGALGGDCPSGADSFSFKDANGVDITYAHGLQADGSTGAIVKNSSVILTDPSVSVSSIAFYVSGTGTVAANDFAQPYVTISVSGTVSSGPRNTSQAFTVETGATMRGIDLNITSVPFENPPAPTCTLSAAPTPILAGGASRLSWINTNAFSFSINNGVGAGTPASAGTSGDVFPLITTIYTGTVTNSMGDSATCNATVEVSGTLPVAPTASLTASPNPVAYGDRSTLTWDSTDATSCTPSGNWSNAGTPSGSGLTDPLTTDTTFTFQCTGAGGTSSLQSVTVTVGSPMSLTGYAWSPNIGWISFQGPGYGVSESKTTGALSGYAWAPNLGWITFNASDGTHPAPVASLTTGIVSGWARSCSAFADRNVCSGALEGVWDGWIALSGTAIDGTPYGITQSPTCVWSGYAWGSVGIGAISVSGTAADSTTYGVSGDTPSVCTR